ncbi:redoxin domain-containing protein [Anatilimnocola sp. NA78]|uniref:TlpA family protein disulfide reductase n=1 Tax=Anatilimnocola sp. NA78 TaxID=3415683 RepID=UPI003CE5AD14
MPDSSRTSKASTEWGDAADQHHLGLPRRNNGRLVGLLATLGVILAIVLAVRIFSTSRSVEAQPAVGQQLTKLHLEPLTGDESPLTSASLQGQVVLINFWGPWCVPCRLEFPELMELRESLQDESRFRFVSVTCMPNQDERELESLTIAYLKSAGFELPVHRDATFATRTELMELNDGNFAYPTTVLLDQQGIVRGVWIGYRSGVTLEMRTQIDALLAKKSM